MREIRWLKSKEFLMIILSSMVFGGIHIIYNGYYGISALVIGIILAYSFILYEKKGINAFIVVTLIHSLLNMTGIFLSLFN